MIQLRTFSAVVVVQKEDDGLPLLSGGGRNSATLFLLLLSARVGYIGTIHFGRDRDRGREGQREIEGARAVQHTLSNTDIQQPANGKREQKHERLKAGNND